MMKNNIDSINYTTVCAESDVAAGQSKRVNVNGRDILICNAGGAFHAIEDKCPHAGASFEGGRIRGKFISCPLHGARFDITNGRCLGGAYKSVSCFDVKVEDGLVLVGRITDPTLIATG
ncbi:MAG: Rieske 2Fe-2S domain-containing protein [Pseudomonas sp.]